MNLIYRFAVLAVVTYSSTTFAGSSVDDATRDIVQAYAFDPTVMSFDEQAKRAPKLGELWGRFHKSSDSYREALRALLGKEGGTEMLYCDGGMLFLKEALQASDKALGLKSITKCSLSEIQHTPFFYTMHTQAVANVDTLDLQFRMLRKPKYQVFIPLHALTLGQDYSFVYPLLVQDETKYVGRLVERAKSEKDPVAMNTLLLALYYAATPEAEQTLQSISDDKDVSPAVKKRAEEMVERIGLSRKSDAAKLEDWIKRNELDISAKATEKDLRQGRRNRMRTISDEALMELDVYTMLIYQARNK